MTATMKIAIRMPAMVQGSSGIYFQCSGGSRRRVFVKRQTYNERHEAERCDVGGPIHCRAVRGGAAEAGTGAGCDPPRSSGGGGGHRVWHARLQAARKGVAVLRRV